MLALFLRRSLHCQPARFQRRPCGVGRHHCGVTVTVVCAAGTRAEKWIAGAGLRFDTSAWSSFHLPTAMNPGPPDTYSLPCLGGV